MAKEEQTTVGLNKPTMALVALVLTVLAASAFWKDRGGSEAKAEATHSFTVNSLIQADQRHDGLISKNAADIALNKADLHEAEIAKVKLEGKIDLFVAGQQATTKEITEMKDEFTEFKDYLMQFNYDKKKEIE